MSILIKGMGMPRHCEDCPFLEFSGDYPYCVATGTQKGYTFIPKLRTERMDSCPLVEIPPHGRLIDADKLRDVQQADADFFKGSNDYGEKSRYDEAINAVANIINAPTIIEAEEEKK